MGGGGSWFTRAASLFRVAGEVARLKLLDRLCDGEWCVSELAEAAGVGLSTVSQQLRLLRAERIVMRRRSGKHIFYSLADKHVIDLVVNALDHAAESQADDRATQYRRVEINPEVVGRVGAVHGTVEADAAVDGLAAHVIVVSLDEDVVDAAVRLAERRRERVPLRERRPLRNPVRRPSPNASAK